MIGMDFRHTLATLAYRASRAVTGASPEFAEFAGAGRTPLRILAHMGDLMDWAISLVEGNQKWNEANPLPWNNEVKRFFDALQALDRAVAGTTLAPETESRLFQGPIADALTHTGQLAMLRRLAGCPAPGENYYVADVATGCTGLDQPPPRRTF